MKIYAESVFIDGAFAPAILEIENDEVVGIIFDTTSKADCEIKFSTGFLIPGLIDVQINGVSGVDFSSATEAQLDRAFQSLASEGTTAVCPTVITSPLPKIANQIEILSSYKSANGQARNLGVHLEGPFINEAKRGAHDQDNLLTFEKVQELGFSLEKLAVLTLAPELPGADELINNAVESKVVVSIGHSEANFHEATRAFDSGVSMVTHLFNAMNGLHHREPGIVGAALGDKRVTVGIIADGEHISYNVLSLVYGLAADRIAIVSDASAALLAKPGEIVSLGGGDVYIDDSGSARRPDGTLASSGLTQLQAIERAVANGLPREKLLISATAVPAALLKRPDLGAIAVGAKADLVHYVNNGEVVVDFSMVGGVVCRK